MDAINKIVGRCFKMRVIPPRSAVVHRKYSIEISSQPLTLLPYLNNYMARFVNCKLVVIFDAKLFKIA